jgi:putative endonuclease
MEKGINLGIIGENIAAKFLSSKEYEIIERNYQNTSGYRLGEIDIVARDPKTAELIFVEVKTRKNVPGNIVLPEENITSSKLKKLSRIAEVYIKERGISATDFRFDALAIIFDEESMKAKIRHIKRL